MRKIIKISIIAVISLVILVSIIANAYFIVWKSIENKILLKGFNIAVEQIIQTVQQQGSVKIGEIILEIKK